MTMHRLLGISVLCMGILTVAAPAQAQVEFSAGYNFLHIDVTEDEPDDLANFPLGWYADVSASIVPMIGVVGQITGNYKTVEDDLFEVDTKIHTFMGGIRAGGGSSNVRPFGQVLFGLANAKFSSDDFDIDESSSDPALQLGAGVSVMSGAVGVRLGGDYIRVFSEDEGTNVFRLGIGIAFGR